MIGELIGPDCGEELLKGNSVCISGQATEQQVVATPVGRDGNKIDVRFWEHRPPDRWTLLGEQPMVIVSL